jgi:TonB family protein
VKPTTTKRLVANGFWVCLFIFAWAVHPSLAQQQLPPLAHLAQNQLCCFDMRFVNPVYPREARIARTEGVVRVVVVFDENGSVTDLQAVSGDPVLLDSVLKAVRQWHITLGGRLPDSPRETEVPLSFTFKVESPTPAYLHLTSGRVIRADTVREFTDRIEYTVGRRTHRISPDSVIDINTSRWQIGNTCTRISVESPQKEGSCIPAGGPSFLIRALPLMRTGPA